MARILPKALPVDTVKRYGLVQGLGKVSFCSRQTTGSYPATHAHKLTYPLQMLQHLLLLMKYKLDVTAKTPKKQMQCTSTLFDLLSP